jgi:outer membrane protein assembly factor BamB
VATGKEVWTAERTDIAWGSPIVVNTGRRDEAILTCSATVDSYDPLTGAKLWSEKCLSGPEVGTSAAYAEGLVFVANDYAQGTAIRIGAATGGPPATVLWQYSEDLPDVASPLATAQYVFLAGSGGTITCLDAKTGAAHWRQAFDDGFYASPILAGSRVYALDRAGVTHVFDADKSYAARGTAPLGEEAVSTPAFAAGRIYLRGKQSLYCVAGKR